MKILTGILSVGLMAGMAWAQAPQKSGQTPSTSQAPDKGAASAKDSTASNSGVAEVKTQKYKGELVDASCAGGASSAPTSSTKGAKGAGGSAEADRSAAGDSKGSCTVSTSTNEFALRTKDGHTLAFDSVGNERAKQTIQSKKKWQENASAAKPINVTISGMESDGKLTVVTLN